jgi:hypothetical protein
MNNDLQKHCYPITSSIQTSPRLSVKYLLIHSSLTCTTSTKEKRNQAGPNFSINFFVKITGIHATIKGTVNWDKKKTQLGRD